MLEENEMDPLLTPNHVLRELFQGITVGAYFDTTDEYLGDGQIMGGLHSDNLLVAFPGYKYPGTVNIDKIEIEKIENDD